MQPDLHISIVSYNTRDLLENCLHSIYNRPVQVAYEVTVIDNGSSDGTIGMLRERFPQVRVLESGANIGYGRANNAALRGAAARYYAILNSDLILQEGALDTMVAFLDVNPDVGVAGGALMNPLPTSPKGEESLAGWEIEGPQTNWAVGELTVSSVACEQLFLARAFPRSRIFGDYFRAWWARDRDVDVPQACGAFLVARASVFNALGGFDPAIFMYCEDTDLCRRVRDAGMRVAYVAGARAIHVHGQSSKGALRPRMIFEHNRSRAYYFLKHQGRAAAESARWLMVTGAKFRMLGRFAASLAAGPEKAGRLRAEAAGYLQVMVKTLFMRIPVPRTAMPSPASERRGRRSRHRSLNREGQSQDAHQGTSRETEP